ncbi:acyl-CoA thioesterase [Enterovirga aerilata]|uniref:Acyl-CoA thioesterase n=1 Tax=Enterovirga aerilata TaxID=2730920 RepID=A0A849I1J9_9HYPH|nr:thioesterase family protein [Enterovirga sp. DB1703]NNM71241.1 acyl-CoA thioesterase [Enterovirga sp. DB1703]
MAERPERLARSAFRLFRPVPTRWMDNDVYGHVNNVVYYSYFDTAVNAHLVDHGVLDPATSPVTGLVVETSCTYFESISFPETVEAGIAVTALGRSSATYRVAIFKAGGELAAAQGRFTHVYVDRATGRPAGIPAATRAVLEPLRA